MASICNVPVSWDLTSSQVKDCPCSEMPCSKSAALVTHVIQHCLTACWLLLAHSGIWKSSLVSHSFTWALTCRDSLWHAQWILQVANLGSSIQYLASHQIDAKRRYFFFSFLTGCKACRCHGCSPRLRLLIRECRLCPAVPRQWHCLCGTSSLCHYFNGYNSICL